MVADTQCPGGAPHPHTPPTPPPGGKLTLCSLFAPLQKRLTRTRRGPARRRPPPSCQLPMPLPPTRPAHPKSLSLPPQLTMAPTTWKPETRRSERPAIGNHHAQQQIKALKGGGPFRKATLPLRCWDRRHLLRNSGRQTESPINLTVCLHHDSNALLAQHLLVRVKGTKQRRLADQKLLLRLHPSHTGLTMLYLGIFSNEQCTVHAQCSDTFYSDRICGHQCAFFKQTRSL